MASVSFYSQLTARNKAIGGLASGLDTDSLVEALTATTRSKLAKQTQQKTLIGWKVSAYRGVASTLRAFQTKHFSLAAGANSLKTNTFFNVFKGSSSSDKITVKPGSGAQTGSLTIDKIKQVATSQSFTTQKFQKELLGDEIDVTGMDWAGRTLQVALDGTTKTIRLDDLQGATNANIDTELQKLINKAFGEKSEGLGNIIDVSKRTGPGGGVQLQLSSTTSQVAIKNTSDQLGFDPKMSNRISTGTTIGDFVDQMGGTLVGDTFRISINDTVISLNKDSTVSEMMSKINNSTAGVKVSFSSISESFVFTSKTTGAGDNLRMEDVQGNLLSFLTGSRGGNAFTSDISYTQVTASGTPTWDFGLSSPPTEEELGKLSDYRFKVTIGDESLTVNAGVSANKDKILGGQMTVEDAVLESMNAQLAKKFGDNSIKLEMSGADLKVVTDIRDREITFAEATGKDVKNALSALGLSDGALNTAYTLGYDKTISTDTVENILSGLSGDTEYKMDMTINGRTETLTVKFTPEEWTALNTPKDAEETPAQMAERREKALVNKLNSAKRAAFGSTGDAANVSFSSEGGVLTVNTGDKFKVTLNATDSIAPGNDLFSQLTGASQLVNHSGSGTTLSQIGIGSGNVTIKVGSESHNFAYDGSKTIYQLMEEVNSTFGKEVLSFSNNKLAISAGTQDLHFADSNGANGLMQTMFGQQTYTTTPADDNPLTGYESRFTAGKNAEIVVDGQVVVSTTNSFKINGVDFEVNAATSDTDGKITLNVTADPDEVVDKIKNFIEEYNTLVDYLDGLTKEKATAGYDPLTDEQKAEMTEDQIKQWENEAKKGLLRNDSTIRGVLDQLRQSLYTKVESAGISLFDIGITTQSFNSGSFSNNGKLEMTESGEAKLRQMLEQNPDAVRELFTNEEQGIAWSLDRVIDNAARTDSTNQGSLVALAGTDTLTGNNESTLSRKLALIEKQISTLQIRLENEYNRYWKQFSALETAISSMNSQSSWLSSFGS